MKNVCDCVLSVRAPVFTCVSCCGEPIHMAGGRGGEKEEEELSLEVEERKRVTLSTLKPHC